MNRPINDYPICELTKGINTNSLITLGLESGYYTLTDNLPKYKYFYTPLYSNAKQRNFERAEAQEFCKEQPEKFHAVVCDITDTQALCAHIKEIDKNYRVTVLVNNAGVGYYGLHEELNPKKIQKMVRTNLEAPMILTQQLLRTLKKNRGTVLNISSVTAAQSNPHGCAYGATKAGLSGFAKSLFDEVRKYGVRVITIQPDMAKTDLYRNADFCEGEEEASYLLPEEVAEAAAFALAQREGLVVTEITVKPQFHRIRRK